MKFISAAVLGLSLGAYGAAYPGADTCTKTVTDTKTITLPPVTSTKTITLPPVTSTVTDTKTITLPPITSTVTSTITETKTITLPPVTTTATYTIPCVPTEPPCHYCKDAPSWGGRCKTDCAKTYGAGTPACVQCESCCDSVGNKCVSGNNWVGVCNSELSACKNANKKPKH